jgi:hypothetical protein
MKALCGFGLLLLATSVLPAQNRSGFVNPGGVLRRSIPSVVQPAGTSALPGVQRTTPNAVFPAGGLSIGIPGTPLVRPNVGRPNIGRPGFGRDFNVGRDFNNFRDNKNFHDRNRGIGFPVYLGGYGSYAGYPEGADYYDPSMIPQQAQQQQPNETVIFPPQQQTPPVVVYGGENQYQGPSTRIFEPMPTQAAEPEQPETERYLIAFKDRSIYATVAYWVEGDTLHYFTANNAHNQASVSLVDRALTEKLNKGTTHEVKLPPAK